MKFLLIYTGFFALCAWLSIVTEKSPKKEVKDE